MSTLWLIFCIFFFQAEDGIRDYKVTGVQTCALPIFRAAPARVRRRAAQRGHARRHVRAARRVRGAPARAVDEQIGRASCRERVYIRAVTAASINNGHDENSAGHAICTTEVSSTRRST